MWKILNPFKGILLKIAAIATASLALISYGLMKKKQGKVEVKVETLQQEVRKQEKSREAAYKEKRDVDGLSDSDLIDRLRRRGDDWGSL